MTQDLVDILKSTPRVHRITEMGNCVRCGLWPEEQESDFCEPVENRYLGSVGAKEQQKINDSNGWT